MELLASGLLKAHLNATDRSCATKVVQEAWTLFDDVLMKIENALGEADKSLIYEIESAANLLCFKDSYEIYKIGVSDGMQLQQEINGLGGRK